MKFRKLGVITIITVLLLSCSMSFLHLQTVQAIPGYDVLYSEGFEGTGLPSGWVEYSNDVYWYNHMDQLFLFDATANPHSGSQYLEWHHSNDPAPSYGYVIYDFADQSDVYVNFSLSITNAAETFWLRLDRDHAASNVEIDYANGEWTFKTGEGTTGGHTLEMTPNTYYDISIHTDATSWAVYIDNVAVYTGGAPPGRSDKFIINSVYVTANCYLQMDDFSIQVIPPPPTPTPTPPPTPGIATFNSIQAFTVDDTYLYVAEQLTDDSGLNQTQYVFRYSKTDFSLVGAPIEIPEWVDKMLVVGTSLYVIDEIPQLDIIDLSGWSLTDSLNGIDFGTTLVELDQMKASGNYLYLSGTMDNVTALYAAIWQLDLSQNPITIETFNTGISGYDSVPMTIMGSNIYFTAYEEENGFQFAKIPIGASFPPDVSAMTTVQYNPDFYLGSITNDGTYVYIVDNNAKSIYKLNSNLTPVAIGNFTGENMYGWNFLDGLAYYNGFLYMTDFDATPCLVWKISTADVSTATYAVCDEDEAGYSWVLFLESSPTTPYLWVAPSQYNLKIVQMTLTPTFAIYRSFDPYGETEPTPTATPTSHPPGPGPVSGTHHSDKTNTTPTHVLPSIILPPLATILPIAGLIVVAVIVALSVVILRRRK